MWGLRKAGRQVINAELQIKIRSRCYCLTVVKPSSSSESLQKPARSTSATKSQAAIKSDALREYLDLRKRGVAPSIPIVLAALKACSSARDSQTGTLIHEDAAANGLLLNICVANTVVDMYGKCGKMAEARQVFDRIHCRSVVSWNSLIMGYAQNGEAELALELFSKMQEEGFVPAARTFVAAVKACTFLAAKEEGRPIDGGRLLRKSLEKGIAIHSQLAKAGHETYVFLANALVDMYGKCGSLQLAKEIFDRMRHRDVISWNSIILSYALNGEGEEALDLFSEMQRSKVPAPNSLTFVAVLKACGNLVALESGRRIHSKVDCEGLHRDALVATSLIDFYGKCGSMVEAQEVFDSAVTKDLVTWTALIAGYSHQGDTEVVFELFARMQAKSLKPNGITFLFVLATCSHAGLVREGKFYFEAMHEHSVAPTIDHYTCMVDLLGRANRLDEALALVNSMPLEADFGIWIALLGACRKWKDVEVGRLVFERMRSLDSDDRDSAAYLLMGNIYAGAGMWEESRKVQDMRILAQAWKKKPGQSWWVDSSGKVHRFMVGDTGHRQKEEILAKLNQIMVRMKEEGYVPQLESVVRNVSDDAKESALCGHSEKLAIGCALLNTAPGTTIRIAKNLRVCDDCHRATAVISKIERRVVICRDSSRFHVFRDGKCSCGDFW